MKSIRNLFLLLSLALLVASCSKEKRVANRLDGIWTITSYVITQDSTENEIELLGLLFSKGSLRFNTYDLPNSTGDFELLLDDIVTGETIITNGNYMLSDDGEELILTIGIEENPTLVDVSKEEIFIEGVIDNAMTKISGIKE